jgi:hypothetical protein
MVITDQDRQYMNAIPAESRTRIIRRMMHGSPAEERQFEGKDDYARALLRLRAGGLRLIDLQPQETAFASVWYGKHTSIGVRPGLEAMALLVWERTERDAEVTTLRIWHPAAPHGTARPSRKLRKDLDRRR